METAKERLRASPAETTHLRVLVANDDPAELLVIVYAVERLGHEVSAAVGSTLGVLTLGALDCAARTKPDLLIIADNLPGPPDAIGVAAAFRERHEIRSILLMSNTDAAARDRAQAAWPLLYLTKPLDPDAVASGLRQAAEQVAVDRVERRR